jgi:hypothetical protein
MAKIQQTEVLSLNGDNVRIQSSEENAFEVTDKQGNLLLSRNSLETSISSLATAVAKNDLISIEKSLEAGAGSITILFGRSFSFTPKVVGNIISESTDQIVACQLSEITLSSATFHFSDEIPSEGSYSIQVIALSQTEETQAATVASSSDITSRTGDAEGTTFFASDSDELYVYINSTWKKFESQ